MFESSVRERQLCGLLCAERRAVRREQRRDLLDERRLDEFDPVRLVGVFERLVHRRLHAGVDSVLGQRLSSLFGEWSVEPTDSVCESGVRGGRVRGRLHAWGDTVLWQ